MTVTELLEQVKDDMCGKRCKFPGIYKAVNEEKDKFYQQIYSDLIDIELCDSFYCQNCPLNLL